MSWTRPLVNLVFRFETWRKYSVSLLWNWMKSIYPSFRHFSRTTRRVIMRLLNVLCQSFRHVPRTLWFQYKRFIIAFEVWAWGKFWSPLSMKWSLLLHSSRATLRARVSRDEHAEGETSFYCLSAFSLHWHIDQLNLVFCTRQGRWDKKNRRVQLMHFFHIGIEKYFLLVRIGAGFAQLPPHMSHKIKSLSCCHFR